MKSGAVYYSGCEEQYQPHFLDACFLCQRPLAHDNTDIFMYRGNTPFCSQECREEQIDIDEANEGKWKKLSSSSSSKTKRSTKTQTDANKAVRTGTVAVS